jgi:hypothetical protein
MGGAGTHSRLLEESHYHLRLRHWLNPRYRITTKHRKDEQMHRLRSNGLDTQIDWSNETRTPGLGWQPWAKSIKELPRLLIEVDTAGQRLHIARRWLEKGYVVTTHPVAVMVQR